MTPNTDFKVMLNISETVGDRRSMCPVTSNDLERLIEIFNDTKYRAVSQRQLNFL